MKTAALITARGYGKGIRDDSFVKILNRPLIHYPFKAAMDSKKVDHIYLSTFSKNLCKMADESEIIPIQRPEELSHGRSSHLDVVLHALGEMEKYQGIPDILVVILGNIVTFEKGIVDKCLDILIQNSIVDTVVTMTEMNEYHPLRAKRPKMPHQKIKNSIQIYPYEPIYIETALDIEGKVSTNRQDLTPSYFLNFAVMAIRTSTSFKQKGQWPHVFCGSNVVGVETEHCRDINNPEDIAFSEAWLKKHNPPGEL